MQLHFVKHLLDITLHVHQFPFRVVIEINVGVDYWHVEIIS